MRKLISDMFYMSSLLILIRLNRQEAGNLLIKWGENLKKNDIIT
jgi:hypothetical protein